MDEPKRTEIIRFGVFEVDPHSGKLRKSVTGSNFRNSPSRF